MSRLTVCNGRVIDPAAGVDEQTDLVLEDGRVASLGRVSRPDGQALDASGCIVCPGLIDPHVHLREPGREEAETIATGAASAINGGFTSIVAMPNTDPAIDDDARIEFVYKQAARARMCNVFPSGAVTRGRKGEQLAEIALMARAGAVAFTDDGDCIASSAAMAKALAYVKMTGRVLFQHCEDPALVDGGAMNAGVVSTRLGLPGRPAVAEELIIQRDILLNRGIGCRYHVQHLSTEGGAALIREARAAGEPVSAEVCPHHLLLTEQDCLGYDTRYKMNPPLRTPRDVEALLRAVADGSITVLATDHAPHTREDKEREFAVAPAGVVGLDCALPLFLGALLEPGVIEWPRLIEMMTVEPARLCGLSGRGTLTPGSAADVTVIDPGVSWTIDADAFASKGRNCPFDGRPVTGRAVATIVGGAIRLARDPQRVRGADSLVSDPRELVSGVSSSQGDALG